MALGFIGTGHITAALVEGLCGGASKAPGRILVSPRNPARAAALAARFAAVEVVADNQAVVDGAATVFLAVRPDVARAAIGGLRFRADQRVISLIALTPLSAVAELVRPAETVVRAVPVPSAARRLGPIAYFPADAGVAALLARVGTPVALEDETAFHRIWSLTGLLSPYFGLLDAVCAWTRAGGVEAEAAGDYVAALFHALGVMAGEARGGRFEALATAAATPGGLNEQAIALIRERHGFAPFEAALDAVFARLEDGR